MEREVSAGGVVLARAGVLLVKVENLAREVVWTFPKGHIEKGETPEEAALREVREETGWLCRISAPLTTVRYRFMREGLPVSKTVRWFRMEAVERVGESDPDEILDCRWCGLEEAEKVLVYKSDRKILGLLKKGKA